jgi:hypothetical protein
MGQDKAGFYSIEALENAIGLDIANAEDVHPEWQGLTVGDPVALGPGIALTAAIVEVDRALVLQGDDPAVDSSFGLPDEFTWAFVLEPEGPAGTRLVIRERYAFPRYAAAWFHLVTWVSWLMTRAMLRGIRHRAEHHRAST